MLRFIILFGLTACAPAAVHRDHTSDLTKALEAEFLGAERELIQTGECTARFWSRCGDGFTITRSDGFVGGTEFFDSTGLSIGEDRFTCLGSESKGRIPSCKEKDEELLCPRALARLRRVGATISFRKEHFKLEQGGELDATSFRGLVQFSPSALSPVSMTLTSLSPGVEMKTVPIRNRLEAAAQWSKGVPPPHVELIHVGESFDLPAVVFIDGTSEPLLVRSHYVRATTPQTSSTAPTAR